MQYYMLYIKVYTTVIHVRKGYTPLLIIISISHIPIVYFIHREFVPLTSLTLYCPSVLPSPYW